MGEKGKGEAVKEEEGRAVEQNGEESGSSTGCYPVFPLNVF